MSTLILPICGESSRFNGSPKWVKRHPLGGIMLSRAVAGIAQYEWERVLVVMLNKHKQYQCQVSKNLREEFSSVDDVDFFFIESSQSQPETIALALRGANVIGEFFVKDCDNYFLLDQMPIGNCIVYADLADYEYVSAKNKSYITFNEMGFVTNVVEKRVISSTFCVGGYGFESPKMFLSQYSAGNGKNYFLSHVVLKSLINLYTFSAIKCNGYLDWGTQQDWDNYISQFATLFIDLDGVLLENSAPDRSPIHGTAPSLEKNIAFLKTLDIDKIKIIITTSRTEELRSLTIKELAKHEIPWDRIIMGLPHSQRIVINDYREGEQFKESYARAFALPRDEDGSLEQAIGFLKKID